MTTDTNRAPVQRPLRLWPGMLAAGLVVALRFVVPVLMPDAMLVGIIGAVAGLAAVLLWWLFFSRAPWTERLAAPLLMAGAALLTMPFLHPSIATGMMGRMFFVYALPPVLAPAFVLWAASARRLSGRARWATMVATVCAACAVWTLFRTDGITGGGQAQLAWRWAPTAEERMLARISSTPAAPAARVDPAPAATAAPEAGRPEPMPAAAPKTGASPEGAAASASKMSEGAGDSTRSAAPAPPPDVRVREAAWPGFRGPARDGVIRGVTIETDWAASPPVEIWRRPVGPGWSSFAVDGELFYTQEQRGDEEVVASYRLATGEPVWQHRDPVRFWESNGGAGPRGTPALHDGRVYALGATGLLNALDARTGRRMWSRDVGADAAKKVPGWGFSSSPLVVGQVVVVGAAGKLAAYDAASGKPRWFGPNGGGGYSSPHLVRVHGLEQIVFLTGTGAIGLRPADGGVLWEHPWAGTPIVQPAFAPDGDLLFATGDMMGGMGLRRVGLSATGGAWRADERWTSNGLKPYFNDFVVHMGHAFGFDGRILSCISLEDGARRWKGGRYGQGQMLLLADQDLLLVLSEDGELALVAASSDAFRELARFKAIEGKTWNHPVLVGDVLLVRNGEEMAAFRLPRARR